MHDGVSLKGKFEAWKRIVNHRRLYGSPKRYAIVYQIYLTLNLVRAPWICPPEFKNHKMMIASPLFCVSHFVLFAKEMNVQAAGGHPQPRNFSRKPWQA